MADYPTDKEDSIDQNEELRKVFPFLKSWKVLYAFVLGELFVLIVLFYLFSQYFS